MRTDRVEPDGDTWIEELLPGTRSGQAAGSCHDDSIPGVGCKEQLPISRQVRPPVWSQRSVPINGDSYGAQLESIKEDRTVRLWKAKTGLHVPPAGDEPHRHVCRYRLGGMCSHKKIHVWRGHHAWQALHQALVLDAAERITQQWRS